MVEFLDEKGDPIQKGFYRDELNGKGRLVFYTGQNKDGQALCHSRSGPLSIAPEHTRYFVKIQDFKEYREETSEDLDWGGEVSNRLENKNLDLDFSDVIRFPPDQTSGIVVIRPPRNPNFVLIEKLVQDFLKALKQMPIKNNLWVVESGRIRIHESGLDQ